MSSLNVNAYTSGIVAQMAKVQEQLSLYTMFYFNSLKDLNEMGDIEALKRLSDILAELKITAYVRHYTEVLKGVSVDYYEVFNYINANSVTIKIDELTKHHIFKLYATITEHLIEAIEHFERLLRINEI